MDERVKGTGTQGTQPKNTTKQIYNADATVSFLGEHLTATQEGCGIHLDKTDSVSQLQTDDGEGLGLEEEGRGYGQDERERLKL